MSEYKAAKQAVEVLRRLINEIIDTLQRLAEFFKIEIQYFFNKNITKSMQVITPY